MNLLREYIRSLLLEQEERSELDKIMEIFPTSGVQAIELAEMIGLGDNEVVKKMKASVDFMRKGLTMPEINPEFASLLEEFAVQASVPSKTDAKLQRMHILATKITTMLEKEIQIPWLQDVLNTGKRDKKVDNTISSFWRLFVNGVKLYFTDRDPQRKSFKADYEEARTWAGI